MNVAGEVSSTTTVNIQGLDGERGISTSPTNKFGTFCQDKALAVRKESGSPASEPLTLRSNPSGALDNEDRLKGKEGLAQMTLLISENEVLGKHFNLYHNKGPTKFCQG